MRTHPFSLTALLFFVLLSGWTSNYVAGQACPTPPPRSIILDSPGDERINCIRAIRESCSFVGCGYVDNGTERQVLVTHTTNSIIDWQRSYDIPGASFMEGISIVPLAQPAGGYAVVGHILHTYPTFNGNYPNDDPNNNIFVMRLDDAGTLLWCKEIGTLFNDHLSATQDLIIQTADGLGLVIIAQANRLYGAGATNGGAPQGFAARLDMNGNQVWRQQFDFGGTQIHFFRGIAEDANSRLVIIGETYRSSNTVVDGLILRLNSTTGAYIDRTCIVPDAAGTMILTGIAVDFDGSYAIVGGVGLTAQANDLYFAKIEPVALQTTSQVTYGTAGSWERIATLRRIQEDPGPTPPDWPRFYMCSNTTMLATNPNSNINNDMMVFTVGPTGLPLFPFIAMGAASSNEQGVAFDFNTTTKMCVSHTNGFNTTLGGVYFNAISDFNPVLCEHHTPIFSGGQVNFNQDTHTVIINVDTLPVDTIVPVVDTTITIPEVNPCCRYKVEVPSTITCSTNCFWAAVSVQAADPILATEDMNGLNFTLTYDPNLMRPAAAGTAVTATSVVTIGPVANPNASSTPPLCAGFGSAPAGTVITLNTSTTPGTIYGNVSYNGADPAIDRLVGSGVICYIRFIPLASPPPPDYFPQNTTGVFSLPTVLESVGPASVVQQDCGDGSQVQFVQSDIYTASLRYAPTGAVIPGNYSIVATVTPSDASGNPVAPPALPSNDGVYSFNTLGAPQLRIVRDIPPPASPTDPCGLMSLVNGADAASATLLSNNPVANPGTPAAAYAYIAADVNRDGRVAGGDITQIFERALGFRCEYGQVWNDPPTVPSYDWVFFLRPSPFVLSSITSNSVPVPDQLVPLSYTGDASCSIVTNQIYQGVLLGDVTPSTGGWDPSDANVAKAVVSDATVVLDLRSAIALGGSRFRIPVYAEAPNDFTSLDFHLNHSANVHSPDITVAEEASAREYQFMKNTQREGAALAVGFTLQDMPAGRNVYWLEVVAPSGELKRSDFTFVEAYVNGEPANTRIDAYVNNEGVTETQAVAAGFDFRIFPNPAQGSTTLAYNLGENGPAAAFVRVTDVNGRVVREVSLANTSGAISLDTNPWGSGIYAVELWASPEVKLGVKKLVVQ